MAFYFLLGLWGKSRKENEYEVATHSGGWGPGWFPACRWGCAGPGGLNRDGSSDAPAVMPSPARPVPAENSQGRPGALAGAALCTVCSELRWLRLPLNKLPLGLCTWSGSSGGARGSSAVSKLVTARWPSYLSARGWAWWAGPGFVAFFPDHPDPTSCSGPWSTLPLFSGH